MEDDYVSKFEVILKDWVDGYKSQYSLVPRPFGEGPGTHCKRMRQLLHGSRSCFHSDLSTVARVRTVI